jgi:hypothetical protein
MAVVCFNVVFIAACYYVTRYLATLYYDRKRQPAQLQLPFEPMQVRQVPPALLPEPPATFTRDQRQLWHELRCNGNEPEFCTRVVLAATA